jgi:hypothetical protein
VHSPASCPAISYDALCPKLIETKRNPRLEEKNGEEDEKKNEKQEKKKENRNLQQPNQFEEQSSPCAQIGEE